MDDRRELRAVRVLVVGLSWPPETFIRRLLEGLASTAGLSLTIAGSVPPPGTWLRRFGVGTVTLPRGSRRFDLPLLLELGGWSRDGVRALGSFFGRGGGTASLRAPLVGRAVAGGNFDVIYVPWINNLTEHPGILEAGAPVVTSCRGSAITVVPWVKGGYEYRRALEEVLRGVSRVHCVSQTMLDESVGLGLDPAKAVVIVPAVDPDRFSPRPRGGAVESGCLTVVCVGSLIWRKSYETAVVAVAKAIASGADLRLRIVGSGPEVQRLRYTAWDLGIEDRVDLTGPLPEDGVLEELRRADLFLHTSCEEGISNSVLEAMSCALPVVSTHAGGMGEVIADGVDGLLVPVRDSSAAAAALLRLAGDADLRANLGARARERILTSHRLEDQIQAFAELLRSAAREPVA